MRGLLLNKVTVKDNFPSSLIDDHLNRLREKKYFSKLDLYNGFYLDGRRIHEASFVTSVIGNVDSKNSKSNSCF